MRRLDRVGKQAGGEPGDHHPEEKRARRDRKADEAAYARPNRRAEGEHEEDQQKPLIWRQSQPSAT